MAKAVLVCVKEPADMPSETALRNMMHRLVPDGIEPREPIVLSGFGVCLLIMNPPANQAYEEISACLGLMLNPSADWWIPGAAVPDGTFALLRSSADQIELVEDAVGTRTIWYVHTPRLLVAATSQRAIVSVLGDFQTNRSAVAWFLSSGTLGLSEAWDKRIRRVAGAGRVVLDRKTWSLHQTSERVSFTVEDRSPEDWRGALKTALTETVPAYEWKNGKWILPLSGGYDSRCILALLEKTLRPRCVTWGLRRALHVPGSDAYVARQLAEYYHLPHDYLETEIAMEPPEK